MSKPPIKVMREIWVPPEARNMEAMKLNLGDKPENSFVWFPKGTLRTDDGFELHYMDIPVGTQLYKGLGGLLTRHRTSCQHVDDPSKEECTECIYPSWYSDYATALVYATGKPKFAYAFETKVPLRLVNLMDKRNLDIIYQRLVGIIRSSGSMERREPDPVDDASEALSTLSNTTHYPIRKEDIGDLIDISDTYPRLSAKGFIDADVIPPEMTAELGDQKVLSRYSFPAYDTDLVRLLIGMFSVNGIHGYYSPTYFSDYHQSSNGYGFPRELCLFKSKGLVFHNKTSPYDGCMVKGGKKHVRSKRHKTHRNQSRNRKHRQHTRKLIF